MSEENPLEISTEVTRLTVSQDDWDEADPRLLETMLVQTRAVRIFEEAVLSLVEEGLVHGPAHSSIGQEGAAVGSILALSGTDGINGTHRGHHQFLSKAMSYLRPEGMIREDGIKGDDLRDLIQRTLSEILGLKAGFSGGRGGSMHLQWTEGGALGTNAIVGGGVPLAAGNAWAQRCDAERSGNHSGMGVTVTYFGDGASNIGSTLETFNLAAAWQLPLCFFLENNRYAVSTLIDDVVGESNLAVRGPGFGIRSWQVDGMDPLAVYFAQQRAVEHMRAGLGPTLIEAQTYRYFHQNGPFRGSAFGYRDKEEEKVWRDRDPVQQVSSEMIRRGLMTAEEDQDLSNRIRVSVDEVIADIVENVAEAEGGGRRIAPPLWPDVSHVDDHIRSKAKRGEVLSGSSELTDRTEEERRFIDVVSATLERRMSQDEGVILLGEDVHRLKGGINGATRGPLEKYPDRVLGTPISENSFTGLAGGMSMTGRYRPVVEFMYSDFLWVAADQVFNQIGKARHMFGGQSSMPVVIRTKVAMGGGYGSQHSMDPAGLFATSPGWRIVAPSTAEDYAGLFNTALDLDDPVLVLEHVDLYRRKGKVREGVEDLRLPLGRAAVRRRGKDVTVVSYLNMVELCHEVAEAHPLLDADVVDLRWLDRASLDWETLGESVRRTNNVLIVEQGPFGTSYGGWLSDEIQRRLFDHLDSPVERVTGQEASPSVSRVLEAAANAGRDDVWAGFDAVAYNLGRTSDRPQRNLLHD